MRELTTEIKNYVPMSVGLPQVSEETAGTVGDT